MSWPVTCLRFKFSKVQQLSEQFKGWVAVKIKNAVVAGALALVLGNAQAALYSRLNGQAVYDSDLNITWLSDANYAKTSGYDAYGLMGWSSANAWAAGLSFEGYSGWRLPTTLQPDPTCEAWGGSYSGDYKCTGSEMGHLFYDELSVEMKSSILTSANPNLALFQNIRPDLYWSGTEYAPNAPNHTIAWNFNMYVGSQNIDSASAKYYAWAVRNGDVAFAIPEPETFAMVLAGLGLLGFAQRRRE